MSNLNRFINRAENNPAAKQVEEKFNDRLVPKEVPVRYFKAGDLLVPYRTRDEIGDWSEEVIERIRAEMLDELEGENNE